MSDSLKLLFLGTAQDGGIPQAGCQCDNCLGFSRNAASIALIKDEQAWLIDATPDLRSQSQVLIHSGVSGISGIFLTHAHWGHYGGLPLLGKEGLNTFKMPVFLSKSFAGFILKNEPFQSLVRNKNIILNVFGDQAHPQWIDPVKIPHRDEFSDAMAFKIKFDKQTVIYIPDTDQISEEILKLVDESDLAIIDGTFFDEEELPERDLEQIPHPLIKSSAQLLHKNASKIMFTHFNHSNRVVNPRDEERLKLVERGFRFAEDWMMLDL